MEPRISLDADGENFLALLMSLDFGKSQEPLKTLGEIGSHKYTEGQTPIYQTHLLVFIINSTKESRDILLLTQQFLTILAVLRMALGQDTPQIQEQPPPRWSRQAPPYLNLKIQLFIQNILVL